jgi:hypothetical protein
MSKSIKQHKISSIEIPALIFKYDFVAWLVCLGTAIAGIFKNQATLTDIGIPS